MCQITQQYLLQISLTRQRTLSMQFSEEFISTKDSIIDKMCQIQQTLLKRKQFYDKINQNKESIKYAHHDNELRSSKIQMQTIKNKMAAERSRIEQFPSRIKSIMSQIYEDQDNSYVGDERRQDAEKQAIKQGQQNWKIQKMRLQNQIRKLNQTISYLKGVQQQNKSLRTQNFKKQKIIMKSNLQIKRITSMVKDLQHSMKGLKIFNEKIKKNQSDMFQQIKMRIKNEIEQSLTLKDLLINKLQANLRKEKQRIQQNQQKYRKEQRYLLNQSSQIATMIAYRVDTQQSISQNARKIHVQLLKYLKNIRFAQESVILKESFQKEWLISELQTFIGCQSITSSKLIYKHDPINKSNPHLYIDNHNDFLVIIKLQNGFTVGGYSQFCYNKFSMDKRGKGMLFHLNFKEVYLMREEKYAPAISYDDYYIIFGNSELRIKGLELKLFSNFGISKGAFDHKGRKRTDFLGGEQEEVLIETYEVYQVIYK